MDYESPLSQLKRKFNLKLIIFIASQLLKQIRIHSNPFTLDYDNHYQNSYSVLYGSTEVIDEIADDIAEYCISSEETVWALAIKGASGSGKSLFVRCLLIEVIKKQAQILANVNKQIVNQAKNQYYAKSITFEFIVSSCNAEIAKRFIGPWIPILRTMLEVMAVSTKVKPVVILNKMVAQSTAADSKSI